MEQALNAIIPENSAPGRLVKSLSLAMRRKQYDRLPADTESRRPSLAIEVPTRVNLARTSGQSDIEAGDNMADFERGAEEEVPPTPSVWGQVRDAYETMMLKTAENASTTSVVPVAKQLDRSLTLGSGFGSKVEVIPTETNLGFKLTKAEQQYLEHLRRRYDGRYA